LVIGLDTAYRSEAAAPAPRLEPAALNPVAQAPALEPTALPYPEKQRDTRSPWGCAAFDRDAGTPAAMDGALAASVRVSMHAPPRGQVGYRWIGGQATDTVIPDLEAFASCLEAGRPDLVAEEPSRRSTSAYPASRWAMAPLEFVVEVAARDGVAAPVAVDVQVVRSRSDLSPYVELLPVNEPFGGVWLLDHGTRPAAEMDIRGRIYPAACVSAPAPGRPALFQRGPAFTDVDAASRAIDANDGPRRRWLALNAEIAAIPEAARRSEADACVGEACADESASLSAAGYCEPGADRVWRVRADGLLRVSPAAQTETAYEASFSALIPLQPPPPLMAGPIYRAPASAPGVQALTLSEEPYALRAPLQPQEQGVYAARVRLAAPETSTHLLRFVALDAAGAPLGASRWVHALAFVPQAAIPVAQPVEAASEPGAQPQQTAAAATTDAALPIQE
jgi:hypothetical protein